MLLAVKFGRVLCSMRELQSLFSPSRARDRQTGARQAQTASGLVTPRRTSRPHASDEAGSGGLTSPTTYRTPDMRRVISTRATPISPAHSEDARQLMFLATHPFSQEVIIVVFQLSEFICLCSPHVC